MFLLVSISGFPVKGRPTVSLREFLVALKRSSQEDPCAILGAQDTLALRAAWYPLGPGWFGLDPTRFGETNH